MLTELSPRMQDYLEAILKLQDRAPVVRAGEIAADLEVSKPTVTSALKTLAEGGFVEHESYGYVRLTEKGREAASSVRRRHRLLRGFFEEVLGVSAGSAAEDACAVEHYLSKDTAERLTRFVEFIHNCPRNGADWLQHFHSYCDGDAGPGEVDCIEHCLEECVRQIRSARSGMCRKTGTPL
jgi:DtxR family Mn-dependent transcriptional regulator